MTALPSTPQKLDLKRDEKLEILWKDGTRSVYPLSLLRSMCPCAACKEVRAGQHGRKSLLNVLPGDYSKPLTVLKAELVGNYALQIDWSDDHSTGIYSFDYLRSISPPSQD